MSLPAKTSIRVDAIIESAQRNLEAARKNGHPAIVTNDVVVCLLEGIAQTLLSSAQQEQIRAVLEFWQEECSANTVENVRPAVISPRRAS